jgi:hypothetical protein
MATVGIVAVVGSLAVGYVLAAVEHSRGYAAARFLAGRFGLARAQAVGRGTAVGFRFDQEEGGFTFSLFQDGNRNGIRAADIQAGIDRRIEPPLSLFEQFAGVDVGIAPGVPVPNPIQLGGANILTFTPVGTATSGTVYVRDRAGSQWAVRVLGATGRTRVLRYERATGAWVASY